MLLIEASDRRGLNVDGDHRYIIILGFDPGFAITLLSEEAIQDATNAFLDERGPLQVVVISHDDSITQYVFVCHEDKRTRAASRLLETWHLATLPPTKKHRYSRLRSAQLEYMLPFP